MINIYEVSILDLIPPNLKEDPDIIAASKAIDSDFSLVTNEVKECIILPRIDEIENNNLIDLLAWQMHVDFYDNTLPIEVKRNLVKNSIRWHRIKGTPQAVIESVTSIFGEAELQEWFEYNGEPYFFAMDIDIVNEILTEENLQRVYDLINEYKNLRSWLEILRLYLHADSKSNVYLGSTLVSTFEYTLSSDFSKSYDSNSSEKIASTTVNTNMYTLTNDISITDESTATVNQASTQTMTLSYELS
jgi:phage tail P2-like protein